MKTSNIYVVDESRDVEVQRTQPFEAVTLSFRNISYSVEIKDEKKTLEILKGVDGYAKPYEMTALMGSSGAGKASLLDVLGGRKTVGNVAGDIFVNDRPKDDEEFARIVGYVEQFGQHLPSATVRESIEFSTALRLSDLDTVHSAVENTMKMVELTSI